MLEVGSRKERLRIRIFFVGGESHGKLYHELEFFGEGRVGLVVVPVRARGSHLCVADMYDTVYVYETDSKHKVVCTVRGPKKDYQILTEYEKCGTQ